MSRRRRTPAAALLCTFLLAAACGSDSGGGGGDDDDDGGADDGADDGGDDGGGTLPDGGPAAPDGGGTMDSDVEPACPDGELGALGDLANGTGVQQPFDIDDPKGPQVRLLSGDLNEGQLVQMFLIDGRGAFEGAAAAPGTYELGGIEADLATCGACVQLVLNKTQGIFGYLPTAGTLTLDAVGASVTGSVADLVLAQADPDTGGLLEGGCTATAESFAFDVVISNL